ncbi:MAG TPA: DinB family protein [Thermoplasmata archaeon]|nr:DinB family protein [Thermoplasmata archaeon]
MTSISIVRRIQQYDRQVFDRFLRSAERRGWKAANRNFGTGHLTIKDTFVHILNVQEAWLVAIANRRWAVFEDPSRSKDAIRSWKELRAYRDRVREQVDRLMEGLTETALHRRVRAPWMPGRYTLEDAFFQVSYEQAHHLGEIIGISWQSDRAPPAMTWIENLPVRPR